MAAEKDQFDAAWPQSIAPSSARLATNPVDVQPRVTTELQQRPLKLNPDGIERLGSMLAGRFNQYELQWERNQRQYLGVYDPDSERNMDVNRSRSYPKLTRVKCVSMLARLMNLLFPVDDKNRTVQPTAVPVIDEEDLQDILDKLYPPPPTATPTSDSLNAAMPTAAPSAPAQPDDDAIEQAIR